LSKLFRASVKENKRLLDDHYLLTLHPLKKIRTPKSGNFFMLSVDKGLDPLLKRPFSVHRIIGNDFQILYRVVGKGTDILSGKKSGGLLEVIGPLGNGFPVSKAANNIILVAGGLGIAPIFALAESLIPPTLSFKKRGGKDFKPLFFYGAKTKREVICKDELKSLGFNPIISTDDGTFGKKGNIINVLENFLSRKRLPVARYVLYACGPEPMLKSLSNLAKKFKLSGYIALEQNMACGLGTCLGCVVNTMDGYKRVCKEGPVFPIEEIVW
jgi:dihydroorotate dehydrogenase electron transfer subunit